MLRHVRRPLCQEKIEGAWKNKVEKGADYNRIIQVILVESRSWRDRNLKFGPNCDLEVDNFYFSLLQIIHFQITIFGPNFKFRSRQAPTFCLIPRIWIIWNNLDNLEFGIWIIWNNLE